MEQINAGTLKLMKFPAGSHINAGKTDFGVNSGEQVFDALLEQKTEEVRTEVVNQRRESTKKYEHEERAETVKTEKPSGSKNEQKENYDAAREALASQMAWNIRRDVSELLVSRPTGDVSIQQPMIFATNDIPMQPLGEMMLAQLSGEAQQISEDAMMSMLPNFEPEQMAELTSQFEAMVQVKEMDTPAVEVSLDPDDGAEESGAALLGEPLFETLELGTIKVAEAPEAPKETEQLTGQLNAKLIQMLENGETKMQLQLEPIELGKLTIELTRDSDGNLSILLNAERAETRGLLERNMHTLHEALDQRGQQNVQIHVDRSDESQRQDNQQRDFHDGSNNRQNEQQHREQKNSGENFLQQLRLGLIPIEDEEEL